MVARNPFSQWCGNLSDFGINPEYPRAVYGGVRMDWESASLLFWKSGIGLLPSDPSDPGLRLLALNFLMDLPLSFVVDTCALPFTIPYNRQKQSDGTSNQP